MLISRLKLKAQSKATSTGLRASSDRRRATKSDKHTRNNRPTQTLLANPSSIQTHPCTIQKRVRKMLYINQELLLFILMHRVAIRHGLPHSDFSLNVPWDRFFKCLVVYDVVGRFKLSPYCCCVSKNLGLLSIRSGLHTWLPLTAVGHP